MAERIGGRIIEAKNLHPLKADPTSTLRLTLFEYMMGNTDWSIPGLHNIRLVNTAPGVPSIVVPYDFDWCGIVDAPYAIPAEKLGISDVRTRVYRGFNRSPEEFQQAFDVFNEKKASILDLYRNNEYLSEKTKKKAVSYLEEFYEIINNPKQTKRDIYANCRQ